LTTAPDRSAEIGSGQGDRRSRTERLPRSSPVFWSRWHILLINGVRMVGSRWRHTLHFLEQAGTAVCPAEPPGRAPDYRALIIAPEPIDRRHRLARDLGALGVRGDADLRLRI
jgi:hypothetical protein